MGLGLVGRRYDLGNFHQWKWRTMGRRNMNIIYAEYNMYLLMVQCKCGWMPRIALSYFNSIIKLTCYDMWAFFINVASSYCTFQALYSE